jgi:hypothetical protein
MNRRQRRKRLLLWSSPVILLALPMAGKLLSLPILAGAADSSFAEGSSEGVVRAAQGLDTANFVEPWKAHFALGDGHVLGGNFAAARNEFAEALELRPGPEECKVRLNLVLTLEHLGDAQAKAGDTPSALDFYRQGTQVVTAAPRGCFAPQGEGNKSGEGENLKAAGGRLAEKQSKSDMAKDGSRDGKGRQPADGQAPPQGKLDQLEHRSGDAQQERSQSGKLKDSFSDPPPLPYDKPW